MSKYITTEEIWHVIDDYKEVLSELGHDEVNHNTYYVTISNRMKRVLGQCTRMAEGTYKLAFNKLYLESGSDEHVVETIVHELLHSINGGMDHTGEWKRCANILKYRYNLNISRLGSDKGYNEAMTIKNQNRIYYQAICPCGWRSKKYKNATPTIKDLISGNQHTSFCPLCKQERLSIIKVH